MTAIWNKKVREADFPRNDICFDRADSSSYKHRIGFQKSHDGEEPVHDAYQDDREDARLHTDYCGDVAEDPSGGSDSDMEFSEDESIDNADMTPLQYARHYGLTVDYFQQAPLHPSLLPSPPDSMLGDLDDHELAPYIDLKAFDREAMHERWALDKGTAELLGSVMALSSHCEINDGPAGASRSTELEMEEAILSSDPEIDVLNFRARNFVSISTKGVEPFRLVVDKDESLDDWATQDLTLPAVKMQDICKAELDIDRDVVNLLREVFKPSNMDRSDMVEVALEAEKVSFPG